MDFQNQWRDVMQPQAYLAKKQPSTNRIRSHSAGNKAIGAGWQPVVSMKIGENAAGRDGQDTSGP